MPLRDLRFPPSFPDTDDGGSMGTRAFHLLESLPRSSIPPRQIGESQICARGLRKLKACRGRIFAIRHSSEPPCFSLPTSRPGKVIGLSADKRRFHRIKTSHGLTSREPSKSRPTLRTAGERSSPYNGHGPIGPIGSIGSIGSPKLRHGAVNSWGRRARGAGREVRQRYNAPFNCFGLLTSSRKLIRIGARITAPIELAVGLLGSAAPYLVNSY
jgi:hypothetical protein